MTLSAIRQQLHHYIDIASDKKVNALYTLLEDDIMNKTSHWNNPEFVAEMSSRAKDIETGKDKGRSWEEVQKTANGNLKT